MVCGQDNPVGMRVRFTVDGLGAAEAAWTVGADFQGVVGLLHGGAVLALLDDAMWYAVYGVAGAVTLTAEAAVRYRRRVAVGRAVVVRGTVLSRHGRLWACRAELQAADDGSTLATATGKFLAVPGEELARLSADSGVHELPASPPGPAG